MISVFPVHAPADGSFAQELGTFLEAGCDATCFTEEAVIKPGEDLLVAAKGGLSADVLVLLLSPASNPERWPRERWESLLFTRAAAADTQVVVFLLQECVFPPLLRRKLSFFDGAKDHLHAMRRLKRCLRGDPGMGFSPDLDALYRDLADQPGVCKTSNALAEHFANEAAPDFDAVFRIPSQNRTAAQIAGELGVQMGMVLDGQLEDNQRRIRDVLQVKRCLVILDGPQASVNWLLPSGRTSILFAEEPFGLEKTSCTMPVVRRLLAARRFAEAYELLYQLLKSGVEAESCARELVWICEYWDRFDEASGLRSHFRLPPSEQLALFW